LPSQRPAAALRCRVPVGTFHAALVDANPHSLFLLEHAASRLLLRGSFQRREGEGLYVFLGSPWITESRELEERGLRFRDFALHDPAIDMLQVMQAGRQTIADSKRLAANLQAQGEQLRAANERLRAGEAEARKLAMIAARTDNAVVLTDSTGRIEWVNAGFTRITGWRLDEVVGRTPGSVLQGPGTDRRTVERIRARIARGEGFTEELLNYGRDGRSYWLAIEVQPMRGDDGVVTGFMAIERDITSERAARDRLEMQFDVSQVLLEGGLLAVERRSCADSTWHHARRPVQCERARAIRLHEQRHGIVAGANSHVAVQVAEVAPGLREIPVQGSGLPQLLDLGAGHRQAQLVFGLGQGDPQFPPGGVDRLGRPQPAHFRRGVTGIQRVLVGVVRHAPSVQGPG
jgi:PAS domain S-box-containing protein